MNRLVVILIVLLCLASCAMVEGGKISRFPVGKAKKRAARAERDAAAARVVKQNIDAYLAHQKEVCSNDSNYDLSLCVKYREHQEAVATSMAKAEEKRKFFLYCQEHPYEFQCIGTSVITNGIIPITLFLGFLFAICMG
jgi:hypothetical protein